jgi:HD-GYP domain-containing protein (c-di-GMP phosphodiesterase class II)
MGLCDTYDALTSKRPYKEPFTHNTAIQIIKNERGKQFDPDLVDAFLANQQRFKDSLVLD